MPNPQPDGIREKTCLVTGASSGIGKAAAAALAGMGASILMVCRSRERGEGAREEIRPGPDGPDVHLLLADLASMAEVRRLAGEVRERFPRIDVLVNNAGLCSWERRETAEGNELTLAVNHLAPFLLTHLLLEPLKASPAGRIINVSSMIHHWAAIDLDDLHRKDRYKPMEAYAQSKLANILFTRELARRLEGTGVTANSMEPGMVRTNFMNPYRGLWKVGTMLAWPFLRSPEKAAETIVHLAASPDLEGVTGRHFVGGKERAPAPAARDDGTARRLWEASARLVGMDGG